MCRPKVPLRQGLGTVSRTGCELYSALGELIELETSMDASDIDKAIVEFGTAGLVATRTV